MNKMKMKMNIVFERQDLDIVLATRTKNSYLRANVKCSFYYIDLLIMPFLMIFRRFPTTLNSLPKIFQNYFEGQTNVSEHFPKMTEDRRRSIAEDDQRRSEDVSIIHQII